MPLLDEVATYLDDQGAGTFPGTIFIGFEPAAPVNTITLYPTGGPKIGVSRDRDRPTMQIRVRNAKYTDGWTVAWNVFKLLDVEINFLSTMKGRCYTMQSQPMFLGRGKNDEFIFVQNFIWHLVRP